MTIMLVVVGVVVVVVFGLYNSLIRRKNAADNAFASVDALLKKRYDLIPNLVATVKQYMTHEAGVLTDITNLRARALAGGVPADETVKLNQQLGQALRGIMVAVENYPQLRASENFQQLQQSLNEVEEQISAARRAFNAAVTDLNNAVEMFPTNLMAGMMGLRRRDLFEIPDAERANPKVGELFRQ